ncbi:MAG: hypothetical protein J2P15_07710 [Micromonosporaceae bacterium]|nr:hypothetical protein [Micromonosporaceae bacterium]
MDPDMLYDLNYIRRHQKFWQVDVPAEFRPAVTGLDEMAKIHGHRPGYLLKDFFAAYEETLTWMPAKAHEGMAAFDCYANVCYRARQGYTQFENMSEAAVRRLGLSLPVPITVAPGLGKPRAPGSPGEYSPGAGVAPAPGTP